MAVEQSGDLPPFKFHWEYLLTAGFLAGIAAFLAASFSASKPQRYSQLIVGDLAWNLGLKQPDYILLASLMIGFLLIYAGLFALSHYILKANGALAETALRQLLLYSLLPFSILLGKVLVSLDNILLETAIELLAGTLLFVLLTIGFAVVLAFKKIPDVREQTYIELVGSSLLFVFFSLFVGSALSLAVGRLNVAWQFMDADAVLLISGIGAFLLWLPLLKVWAGRTHHLDTFRLRLKFLLWAVQGFLPLFFLLLLPAPWMDGKAKFYGYPLTTALLVLVIVCIAIAYIDWFRRFRSPSWFTQNSDGFSVVSPINLVGLLLYIKALPINAGAIPLDDYHWGEFLLPWWLSQNFHAIPFWDYQPARGLMNYVPGLLAHLFIGDTAASYVATTMPGNALSTLPYLSITFLVVAQTIGLLPAFLACLLMPMFNGLTEINCIVTVALCGLGNAFFKQQWSQWLLAWVVTSVIFLLFAPGQGGLLILSMLPLAGFVLLKAVVKERQKLLRVSAVGLSLLLLLSLLTPLGKMLFGAIRYGAEQSSINSVAHGIPWSKSVDSNPVLSYSLWELVRTAWIVVGIGSGLLLFRALVDKTWTERYRYAVFGIPICLLAILFIPRAAGRIDGGTLSRLGDISTWAICLLLPIVLIVAYGQQKKAFSLLLVAVLGGVIVGIPLPDSLFAKPTRTSDISALNHTDPGSLGFQNLAHTFVEPAKLDRLIVLKRVLSAVLDPGETYLDLTNHGANYFYLGYPPPIEAGAFYNLPHPEQQLRAVQRLAVAPPPIVLASADNLLFDGGTAALRTHLLYRYVVEQYLPVKVENIIYLVRPDRLERLKTHLQSVAGSTFQIGDEASEAVRLKLLDEAFRVNDLKKIPRAWGQSFATLQSKLQLVKPLDGTTPTTLRAVEVTQQNTYRVTGKAPQISLNLETLKLNGRDAGILAFDFWGKRSRKATLFDLHWDSRSSSTSDAENVVRFSAKNSRVLIPLDAAPRWLLAKGIKTIRLELVEPVATSTFSITNISLFQRAEIQAAPNIR